MLGKPQNVQMCVNIHICKVGRERGTRERHPGDSAGQHLESRQAQIVNIGGGGLQQVL